MLMSAELEPAGLDKVLLAFDWQIAWCRTGDAPFTAKILEAIRDNLVRGGSLAPLVVPWPGDLRTDALQLRVAGALHFMVRIGRAPGSGAHPDWRDFIRRMAAKRSIARRSRARSKLPLRQISTSYATRFRGRRRRMKSAAPLS
jgi:hypothetical protein